MDVPPVMVPVTSYSVLPALHAPWPGELVLRVTFVVWPLLLQVRVPLLAKDTASPDAVLFVFDFGVHFEIVMLPEIVPVSFLQDTPEAADAGDDIAKAEKVAGKARVATAVTPISKRRISSPL